MLGTQGSLFEEIAEGLRHAKVIVVCVSDDYVKSRNCQLEFRFAAVTLQLPMVVAVVGTTNEWESSEVSTVLFCDFCVLQDVCLLLYSARRKI